MKALVFNPATQPEAALQFLAMQPAKIRQWIMPHVAESQRDQAFAAALHCGSHACIVYESEKPQAFGWLVPTSPKAHTAWAHFILPPMPQKPLLLSAATLIEEALRFYDVICCLVPSSLYGVRTILETLCFRKLITLPKACFIATHNRCVDGILYSRTKSHV